MWNVFLDTEVQDNPLINDQTFIVIAVIGLLLIAAMAVFGIVFWAGGFAKELRHLNLRIDQAASERERQYYIRRRKRLILSIIPFVRYHKSDRRHRRSSHHHNKKK